MKSLIIPTIQSAREYNQSPIIFCRHGEQDSNLSNDMNEHLSEGGIRQVEILIRDLAEVYGSGNQIQVISSPLYRTIETALILTEGLLINGNHVSHFSETLISGREKGVLKIDESKKVEGQEYPPLRSAAKIFRREFLAGNVDYRFGDPVLSNGIPEYPELVDEFISFGETYRSYLAKTHLFLSHLTSVNPSNIHLVITHRTMISYIQKLIGEVIARTGETTPQGIEESKSYIKADHGQAIVLPLGLVRAAFHETIQSYRYVTK